MTTGCSAAAVRGGPGPSARAHTQPARLVAAKTRKPSNAAGADEDVVVVGVVETLARDHQRPEAQLGVHVALALPLYGSAPMVCVQASRTCTSEPSQPMFWHWITEGSSPYEQPLVHVVWGTGETSERGRGTIDSTHLVQSGGRWCTCPP